MDGVRHFLISEFFNLALLQKKDFGEKHSKFGKTQLFALICNKGLKRPDIELFFTKIQVDDPITRPECNWHLVIYQSDESVM